MKITCINCNGIFENDEAICPYCGYINVNGAEQQYLENLDDIIEDFDDVSNIPKEQLIKESISTTQKIFRTFIIATIVLSVLILSSLAIISLTNKPYQDSNKQTAQLIWQKEIDAQLDEWYEQGDYEALSQFIDETLSDPTNEYSFSFWSHTEMIFHYNEYKFFLSVKERGANGEKYTSYEIATTLINALSEKTPDFTYFLDEDDVPLATSYAKEQYDFLISDFLYTEQELDQIYDMSMEGGYMDVNVLYDEGKIREGELYD